MQKPAGPDVIRASIMLIWHLGHIGRWMVMELASIEREGDPPVTVGCDREGDEPSWNYGCCRR